MFLEFYYYNLWNLTGATKFISVINDISWIIKHVIADKEEKRVYWEQQVNQATISTSASSRTLPVGYYMGIVLFSQLGTDTETAMHTYPLNQAVLQLDLL